MDRRDLLKFGALAGVSGSGCASLLHNPGALGASEMNDFLGALDGALAKVLQGRPFDAFFPTNPSPQLAARIRHGDELTRKTLRSLLMVGTVGELTPEQQAHEGVQQRLRGSMGEFDDAMFGMNELLEDAPAADRAVVSKALRDDPELGMRVMGTIDQEAATMGVSLKQRTKLRAIAAHACARLRQGPDVAIAEYTGKARRVAARHGLHAEFQRRAAASIGSSLLWQQNGAIQAALGGTEELSGRGASEPIAESSPVQCTSSDQCATGFSCQNYRELGNGKWSAGECVPESRARTKASPVLLTVGGVLLGLGGLGALIVGGAGQGLVALTIGAVLGVLGLIFLIVGLIVSANGN